MRVYAIGDIHGRHDLLIALLDTIAKDALRQNDARQTQLVFLGDYIDRGDRSAEVMEVIRSLVEDTGGGAVAILGNHEAALLDFIDEPIAGQSWLSYGALQTIASYGEPLPPRTPGEADLIGLRNRISEKMAPDIAFLKTLPTHYRSGSVLFTHAGCNPGIGDGTKDERGMIWGHPDGLGDQPLRDTLLVHGHFDAPDPVQRPGRICVDTGAYYSGRLTAVRLDDGIQFIVAG
ncbi:metallophosphoesterase [Ovoidimarina sediminis]|uniref:metallophosphoesterase n=1 Tax=Ovoidimarina sediminis TaxID=3079856 RepID=UPI002915831E|nr:metallophosphoesterase [Rhodophyticola sp. MJ-SS7]MDU8946168.1 metallophosphoesterase [Rhodophyticola sp. MJ-SS7]